MGMNAGVSQDPPSPLPSFLFLLICTRYYISLRIGGRYKSQSLRDRGRCRRTLILLSGQIPSCNIFSHILKNNIEIFLSCFLLNSISFSNTHHRLLKYFVCSKAKTQKTEICSFLRLEEEKSEDGLLGGGR